MRVISSWSGGKDSCLAHFKAVKEGHDVRCLLSFITKEFKRGCFHGIEAKLLKDQADCMGIPLILKEVSPDMKLYEEEFKEAVTELKKKESIEGMVFGDIYLDEQRSWVDRVCNDLGIKPIEPLWHVDTKEIVEEFIDSGFKTKIVSAKADVFNEDWIGLDIDRDFLNRILKKKDVCPCGENGEFHTFAYDGPNFKNSIDITKSRKVLKEGFWKHWFLDIQEYKIVNKGDI